MQEFNNRERVTAALITEVEPDPSNKSVQLLVTLDSGEQVSVSTDAGPVFTDHWVGKMLVHFVKGSIILGTYQIGHVTPGTYRVCSVDDFYKQYWPTDDHAGAK